MHALLNYNFRPADIRDRNFAALFEARRRDSVFAFVYEEDGYTYAIRDHLGIVPLYYRRIPGGLCFSTDLFDLIKDGDTLSEQGLRALMGFGSARLYPLVDQVGIVPPGAVLRFAPEDGTVEELYRYHITPAPLASGKLQDIVDHIEVLFEQALQRVIQHDTVGLYLSGGIDSALIGIYLKKMGVCINAYTSAPWGAASSEIKFAQINAAAIGVDSHHLDCLETNQYVSAWRILPEIYNTPHGTTTGIGVTSLWRNTPIHRERQVFFGQNTEPMMASEVAQYLTYFASMLPDFVLRRYINPVYPEPYRNFLAFNSQSLLTDYPPLADVVGERKLSDLQMIAVASMYVAHTPSDGEVLSQPAIHRSILASNPYYDMDLIEFCLSIPLRHRLRITTKSKLLVALDKRVFRVLASRYLPRELVYRKKGFTIPFERDEQTRQFVDMLPTRALGIPINELQARFAASVVKNWADQRGMWSDAFC